MSIARNRTSPHATAVALERAAAELCDSLHGLHFDPPVAYVYNPLEYAAKPYRIYLERWCGGPRRVIFLGMNPGPWGMAQVGVPFGEIRAVRDWLHITAPVDRPAREHPAKPVRGFDCPRSEVSGKRLWGLFAERFGTPDSFFRDHIVLNYCPLLFLDDQGRNLTPDKLAGLAARALQAACDAHLRAAVAALQPQWLVGIGKYAANRARLVLDEADCRVADLLHPSPANPQANRDWAGAAQAQLEAQGVWDAKGENQEIRKSGTSARGEGGVDQESARRTTGP